MKTLPQGETRISLAAAAKLVPGGVHYNSLWNWQAHGLKGHKLECERVGTQHRTSAEAVQRFLKAVAGEFESPQPKGRANRSRRQLVNR